MSRHYEIIFKMMEMRSTNKIRERNHKQICVRNATYEVLRNRGHVGESFDNVIVELLEIARKAEGGEEGGEVNETKNMG